jgi:hypothetical protein
MKRIIRQDGPKSTDRALVAQKLRDSNIDISDLTEKEAKAIHITDFHDSEYEYSINHWLSRRSLVLLAELAEVGIYGEDAAEVGARFVDQALKQFAQYDVQGEQSFEEQVSEFESHRNYGDYEGTINYSLSAQSLYLLHRLAELEIYGESIGEVGARFIDQALQGFVDRPRFVISRNRSK